MFYNVMNTLIFCFSNEVMGMSVAIGSTEIEVSAHYIPSTLYYRLVHHTEFIKSELS